MATYDRADRRRRLSRLNQAGPRLIEVGPIRSSVSLKLARKALQPSRSLTEPTWSASHLSWHHRLGCLTQLVRTWPTVAPSWTPSRSPGHSW
jgi:hypothetical protein